MKKLIVAAAALSCFLMSVNFSFAEEEPRPLTEWEWGVYYKVIDKEGELADRVGWGNITDAEYDRIFREVADYYSITAEVAERIYDTGYWEYPNEWESDVLDDLYARLDALPKNATDDDYYRIYKAVADKYSISIYRLYDMEERGWW